MTKATGRPRRFYRNGSALRGIDQFTEAIFRLAGIKHLCFQFAHASMIAQLANSSSRVFYDRNYALLRLVRSEVGACSHFVRATTQQRSNILHFLLTITPIRQLRVSFSRMTYWVTGHGEVCFGYLREAITKSAALFGTMA